jgi:hypothetical protein
VRGYIRQSAQQRGIDPDIAVRVVLSEGGLTPATWVGDYGSSFGPFQLHYGGIASGGNAVSGLGDAFTAETHLDARDASTWRQQVDWALNRAAHDGWGAWHGAARSDIGSRDGLGVAVVAPTSATTTNYASLPTYATTMLPAGVRAHVSVPNQFASNLSPQEAYAACGPAAAVALARYLGRTPTVAEALDLAKQNGWTLGGGMNGIGNEKRLLDAMHISAQIEIPMNWRHVQLDAARGTPVVISTPNHYWVVDDYDQVTGEYHVGQSGLVYSGGAEWMTAERIQQLGGGVSGGLYIDNPMVIPASAPPTVSPGWTAPSALQSGRAAALDAGWTRAGAPTAPSVTAPLGAGTTTAPVIPDPAPADTPASEPAVAPPSDPTAEQLIDATPSNPSPWWEDSRLVRADGVARPKGGPEWV